MEFGVNNVVILLTACFNSGGMAYTLLQDTTERIRQYKIALDWYLNNTNHKILFVENTNGDISTEYREYIQNGRLEMISFDGNAYDKSKGKGYGEALIIKYALENSTFLDNAPMVAKITGRHIYRNISRLLKVCNSMDMVYTISSYGDEWMDSKLMITPTLFLKDYFLPSMFKLNDTKGYSFENLLYDSCLQWAATGYFYDEFPVLPQIEGVSATSGEKYATTFVNRITYRLHYFLRKLGYNGSLKFWKH